MLLDISMPDRSGIEVLKQVKKENPETAVLMLSMHREDQYAIRSLKAGAAGYLTKQSAPAELVLAIRQVPPARNTSARRWRGWPPARRGHDAATTCPTVPDLAIASGKTVMPFGGMSLFETISEYRPRAGQDETQEQRRTDPLRDRNGRSVGGCPGVPQCASPGVRPFMALRSVDFAELIISIAMLISKLPFTMSNPAAGAIQPISRARPFAPAAARIARPRRRDIYNDIAGIVARRRQRRNRPERTAGLATPRAPSDGLLPALAQVRDWDGYTRGLSSCSKQCARRAGSSGARADLGNSACASCSAAR
jgi:CheY-like chemotaxis protein